VNLALTPPEAWQPLPAAAWTEDAARHLLRRAGWSAQPQEVAAALRDGLPATLDRLFPREPPPLPEPASVAALADDTPAFVERLRAADPADRRKLLQEARERAREALRDLTIAWLRHARRSDRAAVEKWTLFLGNIYVVGADKVPNPALLCRHQAMLRARGMGTAPALARAVLRSPAMINYLDLQQSRRGAPNENFARELMELFTLGIGAYTEADVKEAARAFTGYTHRAGEFAFVPARHDPGPKTVFGQSGRFDGDAVIDLIYRQPAAATHLPARWAAFYLADEPLPEPYLEALGAWWRGADFSLREFARHAFGSRLFFEPPFRGACIKSPIQYYLGLLQDFSLDVPPLPRRLVPAFRLMGQLPYHPPNVRGWVGGRHWISSATLEARRLLARALLRPVDESRLNADEQLALAQARAAGAGVFTIDDAWFAPFSRPDTGAAAGELLRRLLPQSADAYQPVVAAALAGAGRPAAEPARLRGAVLALLETPEYQLC